MPNGYCGKILRVNLTTANIEVETRPETFYRKYFGGRAMAARILFDELSPTAEPLSPDNMLVFATGALTGSPLAASGRSTVAARSPLTGSYGDGEGGGFWAAELKAAGFDALIFTGRSEKPVYLWVHDGEYELRDADTLWGRKTADVEKAIRAELGDDRIRVAQCGVAGQNQVRFAAVVYDLVNFAGRSGMGAVMGSKNLVAIAARGHERPAAADPDKVKELARFMAENNRELAGGLHDLGTTGTVLALNTAGGLPTRNFTEGIFDGADQISGQRLRDEYLTGRDSCFACPIQCKRVVELKEPYQVDPAYGGPEYETLGALGSTCGVNDMPAVLKAAELCNAYCLDTISTGVTIAWAMECFEKGLITEQDTGGLRLAFGNGDALVKLVEQIAHRKGFGAVLAEGSLRAARQIGRETEDYSVQVNGQEFPMHDPRLKQGMGVGYMVSPTGADHCHNLHDTAFTRKGGIEEVADWGFTEPMAASDLGPEKVRLLYLMTMWRNFQNSAVFCQFVPWTHDQMIDIVRAVTGWQVSMYELLNVGERAINLTRLLNIRYGRTAADDVLPKQAFRAFSKGPLAGVELSEAALAEARRMYYLMAGWNEAGVPQLGKMLELGI
jgi:aldehyde:ferredoxin oxidoreductase